MERIPRRPPTVHAAHQQPDGAAGHREQHAFDDQLPDQTDALRAHREADRDLLLAPDGARQQQVRDVGAGDQQQQSDDRREDPDGRGQLGAEVGDALFGGGEDERLVGELLAERAASGRDRLGLDAQQRVIERLEAGLGGLHGDAGAEAAAIWSHRKRRSSRPFQAGVMAAFIMVGTRTSVRSPTSKPR